MLILDIRTWYNFVDWIVKKGKKEKKIYRYLRCLSHASNPLGFGVWHRCRPFFLLISKWKNFEWTKDCAEAFQQLKDYLARSPVMSSLEPDEVLFAYIAVASYAVSLVLIRVDNGVQRLVYYVSKSLHEAEVRYLPLEKAILAVVLGTRKLPHYF